MNNTRSIEKFKNMTNEFHAFFGSNHNDAGLWFKHVPSNGYFCIEKTPENQKTFKHMVKHFGWTVTTYLTNGRDGCDNVRVFEIIKQNKKQLARIKTLAEAVSTIFPPKAVSKALHDAMDKMLAPKASSNAKESDKSMQLMPRIADADLGEYKVWVPKTQNELLRISNAMNHCVGYVHQGYGVKVRSGQSHIFVVYKKTIGDGVCFEVSSGSGSVIQAQGKSRRDPSLTEMNVALSYINSNILKTLKTA